MPEGDTLRRAARAIAPVLEGEVLERVWFRKLRGPRVRVGMRVESVRSVGKHLLLEIAHRTEERLVLDVHLGMSGSFRVQPLTDPVSESPRLRVLLESAKGRVACFSAPLVQTVLRSAGVLTHLGPDLSDPDANLVEVVARAHAAAASTPIADVLLDQRVAAGIGNVFKSEALFVARVWPFAPVGELDDAALHAVFEVAARLLRTNAEARGPRDTTGRGGHFVYGRLGMGCRVCHSAIQFDPAGSRSTRSTYFCASCQPLRAARARRR